MSWYEEDKLVLPKLHKCHYCKKRLSNPVIAEWGFFFDGADVNYFCNKECAIAERQKRATKRLETEKLNSEIKGILSE